MEDHKKRFSVGAAIGYFLLSLTPLLLFFVIQIVAGLLAMISLLFGTTLGIAFDLQAISDIESMLDQIMNVYQDNIAWISVIYQVLALAVFGLWYYLAWGQNKTASSCKKQLSKGIGKIVALALCFEVMISSILSIVEIFFPKLIEEYEQLMEEAGLNEISIVVVLATIIMAPVVEELAFRGITLKLALHITGKNSMDDNLTFWIANFIQALAFGIGHLNLVQGCYAFALGIVMGCVIRRYKTLYASIIFHAVFNFAGTILAALISLIPYTDTLLVNLFLIIIFGSGCLIIDRMMKKDEMITE